MSLLQNAEIEVRPRGKARTPDQTDGLPDFHALAAAYEHARQVQVHRLVTIGMVDLHDVAFTALAACEYYPAASNRLHRSAHRSAVVRAHVRPIGFQNRMKSRAAEVRCHRRAKFQRRAPKRLLQKLSTGPIRSPPPPPPPKKQNPYLLIP